MDRYTTGTSTVWPSISCSASHTMSRSSAAITLVPLLEIGSTRMTLFCAWLLFALLRLFGHSKSVGWMSPSAIQRSTRFVPVATKPTRSQRKPPWVRRELIRLKALSPDLGCRTLAECFNRQFGERGESVSKSFVAIVLRQSRADIVRLRRSLKHRVPRPMPRNRVWAMDLTGKGDLSSQQQVILGLLDHGSRACLRLTTLPDKRSVTILRELIAASRKFGIPHCIRVDNEACFNSALMKAALTLLGIHLQTIPLHCPWVNGRIERFFGTLKQRLNRIAVHGRDELQGKLIEFRCWYNHVRPHQHVGGHTPAETWDGRGKSTKRPRRFEAWDGGITGWYFPP